MLITGENVERESGSLSGQDVNHWRECGTREWVTSELDVITGENVARESGSLFEQDVITGENVELESGSLFEQDVNHGKECGTREWVTLLAGC